MKRDKAKTAAKTKAAEKKAKKRPGMGDLPVLAVSTKIRGGKLAGNHVELALLG